MSFFFILTLIFTIFIVLIIIFYMKRSRTIFSVSQVNKNIFKHQFYEINEDFKNGVINKKEFDTMKNELSKRVLKYSTSQNSMLKNENKQLNKNIIIISMPLIILLSFLFYHYNGQPGLPDLPLSERKDGILPVIFYERAIIDIDKRISNSRENLDLYILKANTLSAFDKNEQAIKTWIYIINNFKEELDATIYLSYGETLIQSSVNKENQILISVEAKEIFDKASKLSSVETEVGALTRFYLGLYDYQNGNIELAQKVWQEIILSAPDNATWKKQIELQVEQISKNQVDFENDRILSMVTRLSERLYRTNSQNIDEWNRLGRSYIVLGQFEQAQKAYEKANNLNKENLDSLKGLAETMLLNSNKDKPVDKKIIDIFNDILLLDENYLLGLWVIADNEILGNNYNKAEELLNRILIQLSEGTEEYNLVLRKLNELQN